ncbi:MAG TPA: DNA mismatch repair endonuclease MutL [Candidatus Faecivivens stercoripullorum]|uniref:DNA mismatch repair protein MutL n=1 Tax=Candidatus Faecivivens stercoripullorum TaxID=2840805 RepID=A0A9D1H9S3_9FIRM|nr:DNA mismatch repair endonuclease MutL [Candidatus Faecivivens stercoripullorum]
MPKINVLPREVAELIAAGEVIERPSSIVKELVENSIDAGATDITVEIQYGGVRYLRVTDNGCGMTAEDAPTAFLRHATSKVKSAVDLDKIGTLGFRGEALASIAAVAHVELLTKTCGSDVGTLVKISGSELEEVSEAGCPEGTTIIIRDVFYNVPARLKFLKKDVTESNAVASIVDKIALSHPDISVSFIRDGKQIYRTPGNNDLLGTIYTVLGRDFAKSMLPVDYRLGQVGVSGFVCRPMSARANRTMQHFFVNGRYTRTRTCGVALEEGYRGSMMVGKYPSCVLMLTLPCDQVDVNVHPAKIEVRFVSEKDVFDAVYFAVKSALSQDEKLTETPARRQENLLSPFAEQEKSEQTVLGNRQKENKLAFETMTAEQYRAMTQKQESGSKLSPAEPVPGKKVQVREEWLPRKSKEIMLDVEADPADFEDFPRVSAKDRKEAQLTSQMRQRIAEEATPKKVEKLPDIPVQQPQLSEQQIIGIDTAQTQAIEKHSEKEDLQQCLAVPEQENTEDQEVLPGSFEVAREEKTVSPPVDYKVFGEIFSTYILCRIGSEFVLIDKHAAHERILYNRLKSQGETLERQMLLSPVPVSLSREEHQFALENQDKLLQLGFEADDFGGNTIAVRSVPALMAEVSPGELFMDALEGLLHSHSGVTAADEILHRMACRSAVKGGDHNTTEELERVVQTIIQDENVRYCPHGRPVMVRFTRRELEKLFGRIQ